MNPDKPTSGPHFEAADGLLNKLKGKFSTIILPLIAALILGTGIFLYYQMQPDNSSSNLASTLPSGQLQAEPAEPPTTAQITTPAPTEAPAPVVSTPTDEAIALSANDSATLSETAQPGDGVTHLARRALGAYLQQNPDINLSYEQKIYVEDYLKDHKGNYPLAVGEKIDFDQQLITDAVQGARNLTPQQIEQIKPFARQVNF
ncbi:MAG: hypothetical protein COU85_02465 [Candidatus Portnoybacteria bacterium CG10_big_fil_rev_8_21_14_0_10_44_7]|uniref:Uncharacterized protein n=1 Tax=Candidatus Portnoybacteria bacterium CG10_big_fil_rev_8_21_14_0_10_44_7 TaxID=1974816 RepID=A0A2M8KIB6_9BACT|nr:MAG: hypothetical protein COU85_02465 [Candidatus Portnoybacteria bacterium CG10_big_fil_rev_8_21_14_0_10_44_7]